MRSVTPTSHALIKAKNPAVKPSHLRDQYKDSYTTPELFDGIRDITKSDIYALAFLVKTVYKLSHFRNVAVKNTSVKSHEKRPTIQNLKAALITDV